ncbi:RraA family protein [Catalinimonas niigatensis]|uniref:RraA family protein n=1 Tax=Catalinimonas niigatensis TaxID=1397264 RepID=UPI0026665C04|nr:RraA family protein [Catalinimonas niigatensis]WPP50508.1 RraA family protein [Catalinimonas niigatensis]
MKRNYLVFFVLSALLLSGVPVIAQQVTMSKEEMMELTSDWKGERYPDGRPKVPENLLERAKNISIEEAWGVLRNKGYHNQFEGGWKMIHDNQPFAGRALTAQYMPSRPDVDEDIKKQGEQDGRIGGTNSWPIDALQMGDVYVADGFGKVIDGTLIGDNLGNSIYAKSGNGVIFDGSLRDLEGLEKIEGFNAYVRDWDPSYIQGMMLTGINTPIRIGRATVMPGDVVLAKREGVIFIPAHLAEEVITNAEFIALRDQFGHQMLREGKYTPGQIDTRWTDEIKQSFLSWLDANPDKLPMSRAELDAYMKDRTW